MACRYSPPDAHALDVGPGLRLVGLVQRLSLARSLPEIQEIVRGGARRLTGADGATFVLRDGDKCFYADEDAIEPLWKGQRFPLEVARTETLHCLARAAEYRDGATAEHTERVADLAARLAASLGCPADEVELIRLAAPLHDIGKLAVADSVLLKAGKLSAAEFEQIKAHAEAGASILASTTSEVLRVGRLIARTHHEWWDGTGYPHGLSGESIPLPGRIVALADVYDALTSERPYKLAWSGEDARAETVRLRGRQFDPAVVDAFADLIRVYAGRRQETGARVRGRGVMRRAGGHVYSDTRCGPASGLPTSRPERPTGRAAPP